MRANRSAISRRKMLGAMAAAAACGASPTAHGAPLEPPPSPPLTLGFSLYGMKAVPIPAALRALAQIGYDSVELCLTPGFPTDPQRFGAADRKQVRQLLADTGLRLPALMENLPLTAAPPADPMFAQRLQRAAEFAHQVAPDNPPLVETILGGGEWKEKRQQLIDGVGKWAEVAAAEEIIVAVKPHRFGAMNRPEQALELLRQVNHPRIQLVYDYSHYAHRDLTLDATLDALLPHTSFIHVKDTVIEDGKPRFVLPGASQQFDYVAFFKKLLRQKYRGDVCVEVSGMVWNRPDYDPHAAAKVSYRHMAAAARDAGARRG